MKAKQQEIKLPTPQRRYNTQNVANRSINSMYQQQIADRSINNRSQYNTINSMYYHAASYIPSQVADTRLHAVFRLHADEIAANFAAKITTASRELHAQSEDPTLADRVHLAKNRWHTILVSCGRKG